MNPYIDGDQFGFDKSIKIHRLSNICGDVSIGKNTRIDAFVTITGRVEIGSNCHIGTGACIFGSDGVVIGDECSISPGAKIFTGSFDSETRYLANPSVESPVYFRGPVTVGDRSIVGCNSVVLPCTVIDADTCIGALSLVKGRASGLSVGIPTKRIG